MRSFIFILLLTFLWTSSSAQEIIEVVQIEKDDGLKDRTVDRIIRDDQGYFILLLKNAIQRYDGREFTNIDISAIKNKKLEVRDITNLSKLNDGTIIMSADEDEGILFYLKSRENKVLIAPIRGIPLTNNGELFMLEPNGVKSEKKDYTLSKAQLDKNISTELLSDVKLPVGIQSIANLDNIYYVQTKDNVIYHIGNDELTKLDVKGRLVQRENGIYVFDLGSIYKITGKSVSKVTDLLDDSSTCSILKLDKEENIIAAYSNRVRFHDKLYVLDNNDSLHVMDSIIGVSDLFKDFYTDDAFYRWMLGGYNGIHVINLLRDGSEIIFKRPTTKKGEFGVVVSGVATDGEDEVVFCRELMSVFDYDRDANEYTEVLGDFTNKGDYERNAKLYYHEKSKAYYSHGYRYDGKSDIYKSDIQNNESENHLIPIKLNDIYVRYEDDLIVGGWITKTDTGIIASYNLKTKDFRIISKQTSPVRSIYFDELTKKYWIGTYKGLLIFDESFKLIETLAKDNLPPQKLDVDHIIMCNRFNGKIIASSFGGGIYIIDPITYKVDDQISEENGLTDNSAIGIINDDIGNCWITTFNGINVINKDFKIVSKIYEHDGLPNREFNSKAIAKDGRGAIYSGTLNGVSMLDPKKVLNWKKTFGVDIEEVVGFLGESVEKIEIAEKISLLESYDSIQIKYVLPDYHTYPYVEENFAVIANELDYDIKDNIITIRNLSSGHHTIVMGDIYSGKTMSLTISRTVNYKRYFLTLLSFLLVGLLAYLISKKIISSTKKREEEKTKLNKKISDLQLSSLQSQMNPHFIFNALGAVQYFIQTHDTERADEYLSNFAMLMRSILESSKSKYIRLNEELRLLELYVGLEKVRFEELFEYDIKVDVNVDTEINIPPMIVQPFVENAINHGLYNLNERSGYLLIHFGMPEEDRLIITIEDNGVGRERAGQLRMKKHKSRGTQIVQERLETINNGDELIVTTETIDIIDNGKAMGTKVVISIDSNQ
ncbi:MAG: hypothetical protein ACJATI_002062 [Halioglobus sp.]